MCARSNFVQFAAAAAIAAVLSSGPAFAQDGSPTVAEAPPVAAAPPPAAPAVYNWKDVPPNTPVVIDRAVFDQGGYQLYCHTGETIVVPFENQNLYVMRFGRSEDAATRFINDGSVPTLYVPEGGFLENAAAQGAHWYPFPQSYVYTGPVYMGVAPSYTEYVNMGWYPGMMYYGGYWGYHPYRAGIVFSPLPGLYFSIYDHPYHGWAEYHSYYYAHPEHRYYEREYRGEYHYADHRAMGPAYYRAHPEHGFAVVHARAVARVEHADAVHHAEAVHHEEVVHHEEAAARADHPGPAAHGAFGSPAGLGHPVAPAAHGAFGAPAAHGAFGSGGAPAHGAFGGGGTTSAHGAFGNTGTTGTHGAFGGNGTTPTHGAFGSTGTTPAHGAFGTGGATTTHVGTSTAPGSHPAFGGTGGAMTTSSGTHATPVPSRAVTPSHTNVSAAKPKATPAPPK